jgi:hypothetical protein
MFFHPIFRLALLGASPLLASTLLTGTLLAMSPAAFAQSSADADKPVTPPDSYRVVMENERVRMIEINIRAHSKIEVDSPANRERFLYMLSDGALILAPPGKTPYEFALHAGETAVFPAVSQTVGNDTDAPVRALMVEVKEADRALVAGRHKGKLAARHAGRGKVAQRASGKKAAKSVDARSKGAKPKRVAKSKPTSASKGPKPPLNLSKANAKPAKKKFSRATDG